MGGGVVVGGVQSGSGKTTVTLGLLAALKARGLEVRGCKAGPDFIDAGLQTLVTGAASYNLDLWMCGEVGVRETFRAASAGARFSVVEGALGLFDGGSGGAALATVLDLPVLLVVDAYGLAESAAAVVLGFREYARKLHPGLRFAGVLFNRVGSESHYARLKDAVADMEVLGCLPRDPAYALPQRHLGLAVAEEEPLGPGGLRALTEAVERHVDLSRLLALAQSSPIEPPQGLASATESASVAAAIPVLPPAKSGPSRIAAEPRPRIGVARDRAFCFLYRENLELLEEAGADLVFFSPLEALTLPSGLAALYLGGGYPELHADRLSRNRSLQDSIRRFAEAGGSVYAECGGLMYLARALVDMEGRRHALCGVLPFETRMRERRVALGYREVELKEDCFLGFKGQRIRGHEFHYSEALEVPLFLERVYCVRDNRGDVKADEGYRAGPVVASYVHLHFRSQPQAAKCWVESLQARLADSQ